MFVGVVKFSYLCTDEQEREAFKTVQDTAQGLYL